MLPDPDDGPRLLRDDVQEVICRLDEGMFDLYRRMKQEAGQERAETVRRYRSEIAKLLRMKQPPLEAIRDLAEQGRVELQQIDTEFQAAVRQMIAGLLK